MAQVNSSDRVDDIFVTPILPYSWVLGYTDVYKNIPFRWIEYETWGKVQQTNYEVGRLNALIIKAAGLSLPHLWLSPNGTEITDQLMNTCDKIAPEDSIHSNPNPDTRKPVDSKLKFSNVIADIRHYKMRRNFRSWY